MVHAVSSASLRLTQQQQTQYQDDGFVFPLDAFDAATVADVRARLDAVLNAPPTGLAHPWTMKAHLLFDWMYQLCIRDAVLDAVADVLGPDILLVSADLFVKPAGSPKIVNWHQDANYWGLEPFEICTAWFALTDATPENGAMRYWPGSHRQAKFHHVETYSDGSSLTRGQEIMAVPEDQAVSVRLKAGQMALHHCLLVHASGGNQTASPRVGLAVRYMPVGVRQTAGPPLSAILVRGQDPYHRQPYDTPPTASLDAAAVAAHATALAPHAADGYSTT